MIHPDSIRDLVGNHVAPYIYNNNVFKAGETPIYYSGPYWDNREVEAAIGAFLNGKWIVAGENVHRFENAFSNKFHSKYSLMVNSGSSANLVMINALKKYYDWKDDDEIIVSPVGFPTTISVLHQARLKPVFVDIEWDTLNFNLQDVLNAVTKRTKAIFLSPVLGNPPNMDALCEEICTRFNLKLILDNCDSLGSMWRDKYLNEYAVASSCSFYPAHHISTGEGGMVSTNEEGIMKIARSITSWGRDCDCVGSANLLTNGSCNHRFDKWLEVYDGIVDHKYIYSNMGYNLKPLDLQGAIGLVQLDKFDEIREKRNTSKRIIELIIVSNIDGVEGIDSFIDATVCWFGTPFICEDKKLKQRLVKHLENNKIQTRNYFAGNILMHPGYKFLDDYKNYPQANKVLDKVFFIGAAPHYNENVFSYIEQIIKNFK